MATKKWSEFAGVGSVAEADEIVGLFGGDNDRASITLLRNRLNTGTQNITGGINASGDINGTHTGDGSGLTGIGSGTGGVINTGSTTIGADSDVNGSGVIALQTRGSTRVTVENAGDIIIETGSNLLVADKLSIGTTNVTQLLTISADGGSANPALNSFGGSSGLNLYSPNGTEAVPTKNLNNDVLGALWFQGFDTALANGAVIKGEADADWGDTGTDAPTRLTFWTAADGSQTLVRHLNISSDGGILAYNLKSGATQGAAGAVANELWITSGHATQEDNTIMIGV